MNLEFYVKYICFTRASQNSIDLKKRMNSKFIKCDESEMQLFASKREMKLSAVVLCVVRMSTFHLAICQIENWDLWLREIHDYFSWVMNN